MKLIGEEGLDVAILPIGDNFTMGPDDALRAVKLLEPKVVIPIHYDTFDVIEQDPQAFAARVEAETAARCVVLKPGDSLSAVVLRNENKAPECTAGHGAFCASCTGCSWSSRRRPS